MSTDGTSARVDVQFSLSCQVPISYQSPPAREAGPMGEPAPDLQVYQPPQPLPGQQELPFADQPAAPSTAASTSPSAGTAAAATPRIANAGSRLPTLREAWQRWCLPDDEVISAPNTLKDHRSILRNFEAVCAAIAAGEKPPDSRKNPRTVSPGVFPAGSFRPQAEWTEVDANPPLDRLDRDRLIDLRNWWLSTDAGDTVRKRFSFLKKVLRAAEDRRELDRLPRFPSLPSAKQGRGLAAYVETEEVGALYEAADAAPWPRFHSRRMRERYWWLTPAVWWRAWLVFWWTYGMRTQDLVGYKSSNHDGLRWEGIKDVRRCPADGVKVEHPGGWLVYVPEKTKHSKGEAIIVPRSETVNRHLALFRGVDAERVFPNGRSKRHFRETWQTIRAAAGLPADVTIADTGTRDGTRKRSIRKGCSNNWDDVPGADGLGEWVLGHGSRETNKAFYRNVVRDMVAHLEELGLPPQFNDPAFLPKVQGELPGG